MGSKISSKTYYFYQNFEISLIWIMNFPILYIFDKPTWNERKLSMVPFWYLSHVWNPSLPFQINVNEMQSRIWCWHLQDKSNASAREKGCGVPYHHANETSILVAVHFSMKNIYQSFDLGCAMWGEQCWYQPIASFVYWRWSCITMTLHLWR